MAGDHPPTPTATHTDNPFVEATNNTALIQFQYYDPVDEANIGFPEGTPVNIIYVENRRETPHTANPLQIGANGQLRFELEHRTNLYFSFEFEEPNYINSTSQTLMTETELNQALQDQSFDPTYDMAFMLPRRFTLKNSRWIIDSEGATVPVYNAEDRMFCDLENNPLQGGSGGYLPVIMNPEWQYISFQYFDRGVMERQMAPQFIFLRGYNEQFDEDAPATVSNVFKDNCVCLPWIEDRNLKDTRNRRRITLKFGTAEAYIESGAMIRRTVDAVRAMPLTDRLKFHDLPTEWSSKNWKAKIGTGGTPGLFSNADIVNGETTASDPLIFEIDSIVLTNDEFEWISDWNDNNRFTVFDLRLRVANPDANKPYLTDGTFDANFFPMDTTIDENSGSGSSSGGSSGGDSSSSEASDESEDTEETEEETTGVSITAVIPINTEPTGGDSSTNDIAGHYPRLVAVNGVFYDVTDKRSTGNLIGARAAVRNDVQVHHGENRRAPVVQVAGNFELHYLKDCLDPDNNAVSTLLIFWSCDFQLHSPADANDEDNFHREGMVNSKERWEAKGYRFKLLDDSADGIEVRPVFFFEGRTGQPRKCLTHLHRATDPDARSGMGLDEADFMTDDYQQRATSGGTDDQDVDGNDYRRFVMSHELGHAMGIHDEYLESISQDNSTNAPSTRWNPPLPQFSQYYPGMPYSCDRTTIMKANRAPRLRHFWYFCRWLNETTGVKNLTNNSVFKVHHSGRSYNYTLVEDYKNFYETAFSEENFVNNVFGKFDLFLYKIGDDETTDKVISTQSDFDGILVIRTKIKWLFENNAPGSWADTASKLMQMRNFQTSIIKEMNGKYYLQRSSSDSEFNKVYVYFNPHYHYQSGGSGNHFVVRVNTTGNTTITPNFFADGFTGNDLEFEETLNSVCIYRYMLGLVPYTGSGVSKTENTSIVLNELDFLETWIEGKCGGTYTISQG